MTSRIKKSALLISICSVLCFMYCATRYNKLLSQEVSVTSGQDMVFILIWSGENYTPLAGLGSGRSSFISRKCAVSNCFVTTDRKLLSDVTSYHVVAFMRQTLDPSDLPGERAPHQTYIYFTMESSPNFPVTDKIFDGFFNLTATYRLDSDIPTPYFTIRDKEGKVIGPKINMDWSDVLNDSEVPNLSFNKTKTAAIFVSNCKTLSRRENVIEELKKELNAYNLTVDVFGECGRRSVARGADSARLLSQYHFYLAFENSLATDYVTEKLCTALQHGAVPVVLGGADYRRFLPPRSYLDARRLGPAALARAIRRLEAAPAQYARLFRWRRHYSYHDAYTDNICRVCAAVNDPALRTHKAYKEFRKWWNKN